jgi:hypothetical protein
MGRNGRAARVPQPRPRPLIFEWMKRRRVTRFYIRDAAAFCFEVRRSRTSEFHDRWGLVGGDAAGGDFCAAIVFGADGGAGDAAEDVDLADVGEGVGDGALEKLSGRHSEWGAGGEAGVEFFESDEETLRVGIPIGGRRRAPGVTTFTEAESPVVQVTEVGEDFGGRARVGAGFEIREFGGDSVKSFASAIGDGGESVAEERDLRIVCSGG